MTSTIDSGTQPQPHYCEHPVDDLMPRQGCPDWPSCVRNALVPPEPPEHDDDGDDFEDEIPGIGRSLAALLGYAAAVALLLVVAAILAPYLLGSALLP